MQAGSAANLKDRSESVPPTPNVVNQGGQTTARGRSGQLFKPLRKVHKFIGRSADIHVLQRLMQAELPPKILNGWPSCWQAASRREVLCTLPGLLTTWKLSTSSRKHVMAFTRALRQCMNRARVLLSRSCSSIRGCQNGRASSRAKGKSLN